MEKSLFENPETAKLVLQVFLCINDQMDDSIRAVEKGTSPEEYKAFKRGVGHVMYEVFEKIIEPNLQAASIAKTSGNGRP
jgi:hypothetical protein